MLKWIILNVALLNIFTCSSQSNANLTQPDSNQVKWYTHLIDSGRAYANKGDYQKAIPLIVEARSRSLHNADTMNYIRSIRILMQLMGKTSRFHEAEELYNIALPIAERNNYLDEYRRLLNVRAMFYQIQGEYAKALKLHMQLLLQYERENDWSEVTSILHNIGFTYYKMKHYGKAIEFYNRALQTAHASGGNDMSKALLVNIGLAYTFLEQYSAATFYYNRALKECQVGCYSEAKTDIYFGMGVVDYGLGNIEPAYKNFSTSFNVALEMGDTRLVADNLIYIARIHFQRGDLKNALEALKKCEYLSATYEYAELLLVVYNELSDFYRKKNDYHQLSVYQDKYIKLRDSVYNDELTVSLMRLEAEYHERENIATINAQQEMLSLKEAFIASQSKFRTLILSVAALLVAIVIILIRNNLLKKSINKRLDLEVRKKTLDLENGKRELLSMLDYHDQLLNKVHHTIKIAAGSLIGVCEVARIELLDSNSTSPLNKITKVSQSLSEILKQTDPGIEQSEAN